MFDSVPLSERNKQAPIVDLDVENNALPTDRVLGLQWNMNGDYLSISATVKDKEHTKRGILSVICSVYAGPLGFVAAFVLQAKKIFHEECRLGKSWDDQLEDVNMQRWKMWLANLDKLTEIKHDRCIVPKGFGEVTY